MLVVKDGKIWLVIGSRRGSHIITTVLQMVVNTIDFRINIAEVTAATRFYQQWTPDEPHLEKRFSIDTLRLLQEKGQTLAIKPVMSSV